MTRFSDKISLFIVACVFGFFAAGLFMEQSHMDYILTQLGALFSDPNFIVVSVVAAALVFKFNVFSVIILAVIGYTIMSAWPVEDFVQLFRDNSAPVAPPPIGYFGSQLAWAAYAFIIFLCCLDVFRIANSAVRERSKLEVRR